MLVMRRWTIQVTGLLFLAAALPAGCDKFDWWKEPPASPADSQPEEDDSDSTARSADDPATLKAENDILRGKLSDVQARETQLSEKLAQLEFLTTQQEKQIRILGTVPDERDAARRQVEVLQKEVQRLREELRRLGADGKVISPPAPTTRPAPGTSPAVGKEGGSRVPASAPAPASP